MKNDKKDIEKRINWTIVDFVSDWREDDKTVVKYPLYLHGIHEYEDYKKIGDINLPDFVTDVEFDDGYLELEIDSHFLNEKFEQRMKNWELEIRLLNREYEKGCF